MTTIEHHVQTKIAPGPPRNYFTGNLRGLQRNQLRFFLNLRREYGDVARFRILGSVYMHMIFHPEGIEQVLRRNNQNYQRFQYPQTDQ
jgi:cytochrome P450